MKFCRKEKQAYYNKRCPCMPSDVVVNGPNGDAIKSVI